MINRFFRLLFFEFVLIKYWECVVTFYLQKCAPSGEANSSQNICKMNRKSCLLLLDFFQSKNLSIKWLIDINIFNKEELQELRELQMTAEFCFCCEPGKLKINQKATFHALGIFLLSYIFQQNGCLVTFLTKKSALITTYLLQIYSNVDFLVVQTTR